MNILIINTDYDEFISSHYDEHYKKYLSYEEQLKLRNESLFGVADYYSYNLKALGHSALEIHANNEFMQIAWANEHNFLPYDSKLAKPTWFTGLQNLRKKISQTRIRKLKLLVKPFLKMLDNRDKWLFEILIKQIAYYKPDIIINQSLDGIPPSVIKMIKPKTRLLVGQIAAPIPRGLDLSIYDLMLSSLPNYIRKFEARGLKTEFHPFAFDKRVLTKIDIGRKNIDFSFVGSISIHHKNRNEYLVPLAKRQGLKIWGQGLAEFPADSEIREVHEGPAFGKDLLAILGKSRMTFNHHIGIAENYCNNMRMFEATGMGSTLISDKKDNLSEYFEDGKEIVSYSSLEECMEKVEYLKHHPTDCSDIGKAGQAKVLKRHNYKIRMEELSATLKKYV